MYSQLSSRAKHMTDELLGDRRRALEESFFQQKDRELLERLKEQFASAERKKTLANVSGISDDKILTRLMELGIGPEAIAALGLVPLVNVAWADGVMERDERLAILSAARERGISQECPSAALLESWLHRKPPGDLKEAWTACVRQMAKQLDPTARESLRADLIGRARHVAEAAGGILGLASVSDAERDVLDEMESAFE